MAAYCIPPELATRLVNAIKKDDVIGNIEALYDMTAQERHDAFKKHVGEDNARLINTEFEKAMVSERQDAYIKWVNKTFSPEAKKKGNYDSAVDKIKRLTDQGVLTPDSEDKFLQDLVRDQLGVTVSAKEGKILSEKAKKIEDLAGDRSPTGNNTAEYYQAVKELNDYMQAQEPQHWLKVLTSNIGRGVMLASVKSPLVNIESNSVMGIINSFERRIASNTYRGMNPEFMRTFIKENRNVYLKSGFDLSRANEELLSKKVVGEEIVHSQGGGPVHAIGRVVEDLVFDRLMTRPDVEFAQWHFADSANLSSSQVALSEGLTGEKAKSRALELFKDAALLSPKTNEGELIRAQAIADAQYATYTNKSGYSDLALGIRSVLNKASGNARVGDQVMPFVKTPANVIGTGMDFSGITLPYHIYKIPSAIRQLRSGEKIAFRNTMRSLVRSGLGMTLAFIITSLFRPEEFIGNYPTSEKERELLELKNGVANSFKINGKWVSLDYFGVLAPAITGMMYAKKYGSTPTEKVLRYYQGVIAQGQRIPGLREFSDIVKSVQDFTNEKKMGEKELTASMTNTVLDYVRSRTVPAILSDIAKSTDTYERVADIKKDPLARIKSAIPGLRQGLPIKTGVFGEPIKTEDAVSTILFGSRVKSVSDSPIIKEFMRLEGKGQLPSITDIEETSPRVQELRVQIGDSRYREAIRFYHDRFKASVQKTMNSGSYKRMDDEDKKKEIDKAKSDSVQRMLDKYHYKKPKNK